MEDSISYENSCISVYVINLPERGDRFAHIQEQFNGRNEFDVTAVEACRPYMGTRCLWRSIKNVTRMAIEREDDVIIICEDDHEFTSYYKREVLFKHIIEAANQGAKIMLGGVSSFGQAIPVAEGRFWVDHFRGTQFTIVYRDFFQWILDEPFTEEDVADLKFSEMTSHKMVIHPNISVRHDFGYSDNLPIDGMSGGRYEGMESESAARLKKIYDVAIKYGVR